MISTGERQCQWSLQVKDDVSGLYSWKTTSVISTAKRRRQWSLQVKDSVSDLYGLKTTSVIFTAERRQMRDDVSDLYCWETMSVISTGERRRQWSLQVKDDVSDLYMWKTTLVISTAGRRRSLHWPVLRVYSCSHGGQYKGFKCPRTEGGREVCVRETDRQSVPNVQCAYGNYLVNSCMVYTARAPRRQPFHAAPCSHVTIKERCDHFCSYSKQTVAISVVIQNNWDHFCSYSKHVVTISVAIQNRLWPFLYLFKTPETFL